LPKVQRSRVELTVLENSDGTVEVSALVVRVWRAKYGLPCRSPNTKKPAVTTKPERHR
jgi:hypothetical protein